MKKILKNIKEHWFLYSSIFLVIALILNNIITISKNNKYANATKLYSDVYTMKFLNDTRASKETFDYTIGIAYEYYKKLGYDLEEETYTQTRKQILAELQDFYVLGDIFERFLEEKNIENTELQNLLDIYKKTSDGKTHFEAYNVYVAYLYDTVVSYCINNGLINIELEKQAVKDKLGAIDDTTLTSILKDQIRDKIPEIVMQEIG